MLPKISPLTEESIQAVSWGTPFAVVEASERRRRPSHSPPSHPRTPNLLRSQRNHVPPKPPKSPGARLKRLGRSGGPSRGATSPMEAWGFLGRAEKVKRAAGLAGSGRDGSEKITQLRRRSGEEGKITAACSFPCAERASGVPKPGSLSRAWRGKREGLGGTLPVAGRDICAHSSVVLARSGPARETPLAAGGSDSSAAWPWV
jgi:hypothetical protein